MKGVNILKKNETPITQKQQQKPAIDRYILKIMLWLNYIKNPLLICVIKYLSNGKHLKKYIYTVGHNGGIYFVYPNLLNDFDNDLFLIDVNNSIHSQILLNDNSGVFVCVTAKACVCYNANQLGEPTSLSHN